MNLRQTAGIEFKICATKLIQLLPGQLPIVIKNEARRPQAGLTFPKMSGRDFHIYLDEFQNFTTLSLANMLSELPKYRVNLVLAHQYLSQLDEDVRDGILGNAATIISFRLGVRDAEILAKEFYPEFSLEDLINLPNYKIYLKLMIDGRVSKPFSAETLEGERSRAVPEAFYWPFAPEGGVFNFCAAGGF